MNIPVYIILLSLALFIPVRFHLHLHRIGRDDYFQLEMQFLKVFSWKYEVPFEKSIPLKGNEREEVTSESGPILSDRQKDEIKITGLMDLVSQFSQVYLDLQKYGLGATLFYLFLPNKYQRLISVAQRMEQKGRFTRFVWFSCLGLEDPALTGIGYGLVWDFKGMIMGLLQSGYKFAAQPRMRVTPSFNGIRYETLLDCIFEIKLGYIILAGVQEIVSRPSAK